MITSIETCYFQRKKFGDHEMGFLLNEGGLKIIDERGNKVHKIWNWSLTPGISLHHINVGGKIKFKNIKNEK